MREHASARDREIESLISVAAASEEQRKVLFEQRKALSEQLAQRDAELARIKGSRGWRFLQSYGRLKHRRLLPFLRSVGLAGDRHDDPPVVLTVGAQNPESAKEDAGSVVTNNIALVTANFGGIDEVKALPDHEETDAFYYTDQSVSPEVARTWTRIINPNYPRYDLNPRLRAKYFKLQIHRLDSSSKSIASMKCAITGGWSGPMPRSGLGTCPSSASTRWL
jgi:hypothetical protein